MIRRSGIRVWVCMLLAVCALPVLCRAQTGYFIPGTLDDQLERKTIDRKHGQVDHYYANEKPLADYVFGLVEMLYGGEGCRLEEKNGWDLYAPKLQPVIDSLYIVGADVIENKTQALAFVHGFFVRHGRWYDVGDTYCIDTPDVIRGRVFYKAAMMLGLPGLEIAALPGVARTTRIIFRPTDELMTLIESTRPISNDKVGPLR
ncbi:MAG: hypothetical protein LBU95_01045 [Rikenellaceae bacterium]|jgi:hypothetical protein|nr:hypothetical protein [Rikenellaceae bacterium]